MRKVIAIVAIATLAACGGASTEVKTDSTAVAVDSTAVVTTDSTAVVTEPAVSGASAPAAGNEAIK
jgi:hypothetical protein